MELKRRNSDSNLYRKAQGSESTNYLIQSEKPEENQTKYLDDERRALLQSYLENTEDVRSVTTETTDSGIPGTHGTPSAFGIEETNGKEIVFIFCSQRSLIVFQLKLPFGACNIYLFYKY